MDAWGQKLDFWEEAIEKTIDIEVKMLLELPSGTREINTKYFLEYKLAKKETNSKKNKSTGISSANIPNEKQSSSTYQKKNRNH